MEKRTFYPSKGIVKKHQAKKETKIQNKAKILHGKNRTHNNDLAPNVWLPSSVGRAGIAPVFAEVTG